MKNPAGIKLCISHKIATSRGPLLKVTVLIKAIIICEDDGMYGLTVTSWGNPVDGMGDCFHLLCQAGAWDHIDCTVLMDGTYTLLDSETPPWMVFGYWAISVHYEVLRFAVFLNAPASEKVTRRPVSPTELERVVSPGPKGDDVLHLTQVPDVMHPCSQTSLPWKPDVMHPNSQTSLAWKPDVMHPNSQTSLA